MSKVRKQVEFPEDALIEEAERFIRERAKHFSPPIINTLITELREQLAAGVHAGERISDLKFQVPFHPDRLLAHR